MNLEQRIAALESLTADLAGQTAHARRSARRWRLAALGAGLAMVGAVGMAASRAGTVADEITAERIEIVNGDDDVMVELTSDDFGGIVRIFNAEGGPGARMEVDSAGGIIVVHSTEDDSVGALIDVIDGGGRVMVTNSDGGERTLSPR